MAVQAPVSPVDAVPTSGTSVADEWVGAGVGADVEACDGCSS